MQGSLFWKYLPLLLCVVARPFFTLWAGPEYGRESTLPLYILAAGLVFEVMAFVPCIPRAVGRSDLIARCHLIVMIPYLVVSAILISWYGAAGAAAAWSARAPY